MNKNPLKNKSYTFALRIVRTCKTIMAEHKEYILTKQLIRSGTSVGANIFEAQQPQSKRDFVAKLSIAQKEAIESEYWLNLLRDIGYIADEDVHALCSELKEIRAMIGGSIKTTKQYL